MRRKLVQQGKSTLTVSLPKAWTQQNDLARGDEVELLPAGRELRLSLPSAKLRPKRTLDVSGMSPALARSTLNTAYVLGEQELQVRCRKTQHVLLQDTVDKLIGLAIVSQKPESMLIKDVTAPGEVEIESLLRRIYRLVLDLGEGCLADIETLANSEKPQTTVRAAQERDFGVNRFVNFTLRQLNLKADLEQSENAALFHLVLLLELVGDEYTNLWKELLESGEAVSEEILALYQLALSTTKTCYDVLYSYDQQEAAHVSRTRNIIRDRLEEAHRDAGLPVAFHIRKIAELSVNLLQAQLLLTLQEDNS